MVVISLTGELKEWASKHRPLLDLHAITKEANFGMDIGVFTEEVTVQERDKLSDLIHRNYFVIPKTEVIWQDAFDLFFEGKYHHCMLLLFPALEHGLRRIFVCSNNCTERMLTAENDVLYTTLDVRASISNTNTL
jgi:hypothetical protein